MLNLTIDLSKMTAGQLENQLAAAQSKINSFVTFGIEPTDCVCGHEQSDHDAQGLHPCGQCICEEYYVIQPRNGRHNSQENDTMLNLTIDLSKMTAGQLAHLYLVVVKMGRIQDADLIYKSLCANCGEVEADRIIGVINTEPC